MEDKCLSVITNFGCHFKCPYCVTKTAGINIPRTYGMGLMNLADKYRENGCNIISVSGGGDPLYGYNDPQNITLRWWNAFFQNIDEIQCPIELHTSYLTCSNFPYDKFYRMVYHLQHKTQLLNVRRKGNQIVRVVFVVTPQTTLDDIFDIVECVNQSSEIDELSFRQMINPDYSVDMTHYDVLKAGHKKLWWYIEQNDYNLYYVSGEVHTKFEDFKKG